MLKAVVKKMVRQDHWLFLGWSKDRFGFAPTIVGFIKMLFNQGIGRVPNPLNGGTVFIRPGTTDQDVYDEIFFGKEYDLDLGNPHFIVDAGAHIGLSSVYFACKYPNATIVALEPEKSNFEMLVRNTRRFANIKPMCAGLWSRKAHLRIQNQNVETWSFRVVEDVSGQGIPAVGIADVMAEHGITHIDVLKIDIEGSEVEVLKHSASWIGAIGALIIELHDRFQPGCTEALENAVRGYQYDKSHSGESDVITNLRKVAA